MFKLCHDQCLENANWYGTKDNKLEYIEAWKYSDIDRSNDENFRHGYLDDHQIVNWFGHDVSITFVLYDVSVSYFGLQYRYQFTPHLHEAFHYN
jgi:hypothetical protein